MTLEMSLAANEPRDQFAQETSVVGQHYGDQAGPIRPTAICGDLGGVMRIGLIRFTRARVLQQVPVTI